MVSNCSNNRTTSEITNCYWHCKQHILNFKKILTQPRVERVVHTMLTSRVLLHIRAQAGDDPVWSDGLTELNTIHIS